MMTVRASIKPIGRLLLALLSIVLWTTAPGALAQGTTPQNDPALAPSVPASRQADRVAIITLHGEIDRWSELSIKRRIKQAEQSGADAIVLEIDSPGGEVGAVLEICNALKGSTIPNTVAWVRPDAYSGGAIAALACREIVTSSPASMGDAFPITFGPMGVRGLNPDERTKFLPPLLTEVADSARRHGYDEFLVQAMVADGIELWSVRDAQTGERWFINEAEYRVLFDGDPPRGKPVLTSVTGGRAADQSLSPRTPAEPAAADPEADPTAGPTTDPESESESESDQAEQGVNPGSDPEAATDADDDTPASDPDQPPSPTDEGTAFTPAAPGLSDLSSSISDTLRVGSARPTFTAADRGAYIDPIYISDGTGPIVLRDDQLREFGFSSEIIQNDDQLRDYFGAKEMVRTEQTWSESLAKFMMNPVIRGVLIVVLLVGLFIEMSSPGMIVPGGLAVAALIGIIAPPMLVGMAGWWEVAALAAGALCLFVELLVLPGFGVFGILGLIALFAGLVGTFIPDGSGGLFSGNQEAATGMLYGVVTVLLATVTASVAIYFLARNFGSFPLLGRLILADASATEEDPIAVMAEPEPDHLPGDLGVASTHLLPSGKVRVAGRMIDATAQRGTIESGETVELVRRDSFTWIVRPAKPGPSGTGSNSNPDTSPETEPDHP